MCGLWVTTDRVFFFFGDLTQPQISNPEFEYSSYESLGSFRGERTFFVSLSRGRKCTCCWQRKSKYEQTWKGNKETPKMASSRKLDLFDSVGYTHSHLAPNEDEEPKEVTQPQLQRTKHYITLRRKYVKYVKCKENKTNTPHVLRRIQKRISLLCKSSFLIQLWTLIMCEEKHSHSSKGMMQMKSRKIEFSSSS